MMTPSPNFTSADKEKLARLAAKYAPNGGSALEAQVRGFANRLSKARGRDAKDAVRREFFDSHPMPTDDELAEIRELHNKLCHAHGCELGTVGTALEDAHARGLLTDAELAQKTREAEQRELTSMKHDAYVMRVQYGRMLSERTFASTATDAEMGDAADRWAEKSKFLKARDEFRERYAAASIEEKVALRQEFPEFVS